MAGFAGYRIGEDQSAGIAYPDFSLRALIAATRLDEIALPSQFGHWGLRSEGAWGVPPTWQSRCFCSLVRVLLRLPQTNWLELSGRDFERRDEIVCFRAWEIE